MSDRLALDMLNRFRQPGSAAGEKLTWYRELRRVENEALKADGQKPAGRLSQATYDAIMGLRELDVRDDVRPQLRRLQAQARDLLWVPGGGGGAVALRPGHVSLPVFINADGWAVTSASTHGQPRDNKDLLLGAFGMEEAVRRQLRISRSSLPQLLSMDMNLKAKMVDTAIATAERAQLPADQALPGLTREETQEVRSSAFTNLLALSTTIDNERLNGRIFQQLRTMAEREPHRWLGEHMVRMLNHPLYQTKLTPAQKVEAKEAFEARHRPKFEVKHLTDAQGFVRWEHVCGEGENFFESFKHTMQEPSIHGAKFKLVPGSDRGGSYDLLLEFNPPKRVDGQEIRGIKMHVRRFRNDMFDAVGKNLGTPERPVKAGFSYGGHSQIGENQERSLKRALAEGRYADTPQLCILDLCAGLDNLDADRKALGDLDVLTTHDSSYFHKGPVYDADGRKVVDEGVTSSEGQDTLVEVLESLTAGETFEQLDDRFRRVIPEWQHPEPPNTHVPTLANYQKVLDFHGDSDGDAVMDARDIHYHCVLKEVPADREHEFQLKALPDGMRPDMVRGAAALNAVLDMNVATHYNAVTHRQDAVLHKFVGDGFFDGEGQRDLVRFNYEEIYSGKKGILVQYNSRLAHTSREALEALTMYTAMVTLADRGEAGAAEGIRGLSEVDRKLMGLTFAAFRLNYDGEGSWNDERIWKQLLEVLRLPANLPLDELVGLLDAEHHDYSGNLQLVQKYKDELRRVDPNLLRELEKRDVGRPVGDG